MRWNALGIFRPGADIAEVRVTSDRARVNPSFHRAPECAGIRLNAPEIGTIWAHPKVRRRPRTPAEILILMCRVDCRSGEPRKDDQRPSDYLSDSRRSAAISRDSNPCLSRVAFSPHPETTVAPQTVGASPRTLAIATKSVILIRVPKRAEARRHSSARVMLHRNH